MPLFLEVAREHCALVLVRSNVSMLGHQLISHAWWLIHGRDSD
jgi:hypothetical protein